MPATRTKRTTQTLERGGLPNGLRVIMAPDRSAPAVHVALYYDVGFRSEPEGRTGFAHLFEHLMFQGSATLEKGYHDELIGANGGTLNGSTRPDFTNYYETLPSNALELGLFLEADRMRGIRLTPETLRNQIDVVKEEVRLNVMNRPYGGFPWIDLPAALFDTFPNAHNGYGDFVDLEAATIEDAEGFFDRFYAPGNALCSVTGDFDPDECMRMIERHFGDIPPRTVPDRPDFAEPLPGGERRVTKVDPLAPEPAIALGYRIPDPIGQLDDFMATILLSEVMTAGDAARLHQRLVKSERVANHLVGWVGLLDTPFGDRSPSMLQQMIFYPGEPDPDRILGPLDDELSRISGGIDEDEVDRFRSALLADYLTEVDGLESRGSLIAVTEQQRGAAELVAEMPERFAAVTAGDVARVAGEWFVPDNRAVIDLRPGAKR